MNWQEILVILLPLLGLMSWVYSRLEKRFDKIDDRFDKVDEKLQTLDSRISRIEGQLIGTPNWEPKIVHKKEEK